MRLRKLAVSLGLGFVIAIVWTVMSPETIADSGLVEDAGPATLPAQESEGGEASEVRTQAITVVLVRHAEKGTDDARDPSLSKKGEVRAHDLAQLLGHARVTHLFASEYKRTQSTLVPLAQQVGVEVKVHPARDGKGMVALLRALAPGSVAVVAGHSNTVPNMAEALGALIEELEETPRGRMLGEKEYDRMFIVQLYAEASGMNPHLLELRYGDTE
ncbi:MAG: phosphohistidine phosphatase SixA [Planctomycetota bacterium]|jgi:phosphohistidine phosphatase SixA